MHLHASMLPCTCARLVGGGGHGCVVGVGPAGVGWDKSQKAPLVYFFSLASKRLLVPKKPHLFVYLDP